MKYIFYILIGSCLISCQNKPKYKYIQTDLEDDLLGTMDDKEQEPEIIEAETDSIAYLEAYTKFIISTKVHLQMKEEGNSTFRTPKKFRLLDPNGVDITDIVEFKGKDSLVQSIESTITGIVEKNSAESKATVADIMKIDEQKVKELMPFFKIKKDEYSNDGEEFIIPKNSPRYSNENGFYMYFQNSNYGVGNLRIKLQYYAEDWLFIKTVKILIDGKAYELTPDNTNTDHSDGYVWEWFDQQVGYSEFDLVEALANGKNAKMKLIGRQYYKEKVITKKQLLTFKQTLELYKAKGGKVY